MNPLINPNYPDLVQDLHREEIDCKEKECEVDAVIRMAGLKPCHCWKLKHYKITYLDKTNLKPKP